MVRSAFGKFDSYEQIFDTKKASVLLQQPKSTGWTAADCPKGHHWACSPTAWCKTVPLIDFYFSQ
jgi:hypothetical protein